MDNGNNRGYRSWFDRQDYERTIHRVVHHAIREHILDLRLRFFLIHQAIDRFVPLTPVHGVAPQDMTRVLTGFPVIQSILDGQEQTRNNIERSRDECTTGTSNAIAQCNIDAQEILTQIHETKGLTQEIQNEYQELKGYLIANNDGIVQVLAATNTIQDQVNQMIQLMQTVQSTAVVNADSLNNTLRDNHDVIVENFAQAQTFTADLIQQSNADVLEVLCPSTQSWYDHFVHLFKNPQPQTKSNAPSKSTQDTDPADPESIDKGITEAELIFINTTKSVANSMSGDSQHDPNHSAAQMGFKNDEQKKSESDMIRSVDPAINPTLSAAKVKRIKDKVRGKKLAAQRAHAELRPRVMLVSFLTFVVTVLLSWFFMVYLQNKKTASEGWSDSAWEL